MKLYKYYEDCGRMGSIEGLFFATEAQIKKYSEANLYWNELLGKHSEGTFDFSEETLEVIELPEDVIKLLYKELGQVVSGPFDFDYFDELIAEQGEESEDD